MGRAGRRGQSVAADELQDQEAGPAGADPAQQGAEPVRQVLGAAGEVGGGLAGDQPDLHPVGVAGGGHLAEYREQDPALVDVGARRPMVITAAQCRW